MEVWKDISGFENRYQISSDGEIKSFIRDRFIKKCISRGGYYRITLVDSKGKKTNHHIHILVAKHFVPNTENKPLVNHKDRQRTNNNASNLEWVTHAENIKHGYSFGDFNISGLSNLSIETVKGIKCDFLNGMRQCDLSKKYNVHKATVRNIVIGRTWKHIRILEETEPVRA